MMPLFTPVQVGDIAMDTPLKHDIFDGHGKLLLKAGTLIGNREQFDKLMKHGFLRSGMQGMTPSRTQVKENLLTKPSVKTSDIAEKSQAQVQNVVRMDDVRWQIGETVYLQQIDNQDVRYTVHLLGYIKNKTIFLSAPTQNGKSVFLRDGQTFVARAFSGKRAFAFTASVEKSVHTPHAYVHLSYPKELRSTVVRRGIRVPVKVMASLTLGQPERVAEVTVTDLSTGGASVASNLMLGKPREEGRMELKLQVDDQVQSFDLRVGLRSVRTSELGDGFKHGFEFLNLPIHDSLILSSFISQTLNEGI